MSRLHSTFDGWLIELTAKEVEFAKTQKLAVDGENRLGPYPIQPLASGAKLKFDGQFGKQPKKVNTTK